MSILIKRVADIVVDTLIEYGIEQSFSVVGGGAMHLNNAFAIKKDRIRTIYNHHEQACSMAAEAYARLSGKMACVCVTSGPGGTNAINGVQGAWVDSVPMIVISGHPRYDTTVDATNGLNIRTRGVQENDIIHMVSKITKYSKLITDPLSIKSEISKAISIAMSGRRGPVWLAIPLDVQGCKVDEDLLTPYQDDSIIVDSNENNKDIRIIVDLLKESSRPVLLTGSGIRTGGAHNGYKEFIKNIKVPIVGGSLQADINYIGEDNYFGMSGSIGPRCGNFILQSADLIIVLGNSLSTKQTGFNQEAFAPNAKIIMIDAEADEARKPGLHVDYIINLDLNTFFKKCIDDDIRYIASDEWFDHCKMVYNSFSSFEVLNNHKIEETSRIPSLLFWKEFLPQIDKNAVICLGNSNSIAGVLQEGVYSGNQRVLVNYNTGSMGDDIPEAIGAAVYDSSKPVYLVTGDGSIMMNLQEFQTVNYYGLNIKTIVFNNNGYGAIRNTCSRFFDGLYTGCDDSSGVNFPKFINVANTFNLGFKRCSSISELSDSIDWIIHYDGSCILEVDQLIDEIPGLRLTSKMDENGQFKTSPLHELSPELSEDEINKYIIR